MAKLSFSGHESFICKQFWLKKVYDFSKSDMSFSDDLAVVELGVGKNMVSSLKYWGRTFGILDENNQPTEIADLLFSKSGKDIYLEDIGTIWLLQYLLVSTNKASIYNIIFNEFRKERNIFSKEQLHNFLRIKCEEAEGLHYNENTINSDIKAFLKSYLKPDKEEKNSIEDDFNRVLIDLDLLKMSKEKYVEDGKVVIKSWYRIESDERHELPYQIVLYSILNSYPNQQTLTFRELHRGVNSPGVTFALTEKGLYNKLVEISENYKQITYTETAGNQVLQFKKIIKPETVLNDYYS